MQKKQSDKQVGSHEVIIQHFDVVKNRFGTLKTEDLVVQEEPLEIGIEFGPESIRSAKNVAVTMRTPGDDSDLMKGFLWTEGLISDVSDIKEVIQLDENRILASLVPEALFDLNKIDRNFFTSSSCGICGKGSIDAIETISQFPPADNIGEIKASVILSLPDIARASQRLFDKTGGIHGASLFNLEGQLICTKEDVGRHNAVDKLIGWAMKNIGLPLRNHVIFVSGRCGYELMQKSILAGCTHFFSVGAPSSLAVELANENNVVMGGFIKADGFNIYSGVGYVRFDG